MKKENRVRFGKFFSILSNLSKERFQIRVNRLKQKHMKIKIKILGTLVCSFGSLLFMASTFGLEKVQTQAQTRIVEDIVAIFQDHVITKSQVDRIRNNYEKRSSVSIILYPPGKNSVPEITKQILRTLMIREELKEMNYTTGDKEVDAEVNKIKARMQLDEFTLDEFLKNQGLSLREYREIIQDTLDFQSFQQLHIRPSLSEPTDQQVKNRFFQANQKNMALSFKYKLVQYSLPQSVGSNLGILKEIPNQLKEYLVTKIIPSHLQGMTQEEWGESKEDSFTSQIANALKGTDEGSFTSVIKVSGEYVSFYVEKKDVVESDVFAQAKDEIKGLIYQEELMKAMDQWEERKKSKHYVREFAI